MRTGGGGRSRPRFTPVSYVFMALMLVSFSCLLFSTRSFVVNFKGIGLSAFSGIRGGIHEVSSLVSRTVLSIKELSTLRQEYAELTDRIARYEMLERSAAEIDQENRRLREQMGFSQTMRFRSIPAQLIGRDPDNLFQALVINKGRRAGIANNMAVIAYHNGAQGLVGKVIEAGEFESLVMPVYDSVSNVSSGIPSRISGPRYEGMVEGQGSPDLPLLMRYIQKRARDEINVGDMIISSGIGGVYPSGINIGRVSKINYLEKETSIEVELESVIDFSRLEYMFVIKAEKEIND